MPSLNRELGWDTETNWLATALDLRAHSPGERKWLWAGRGLALWQTFRTGDEGTPRMETDSVLEKGVGDFLE